MSSSKGGRMHSQTKGQLHTTDTCFLEFAPCKQRSLTDNTLITTPELIHTNIITHKCHKGWAVSGHGQSRLDL